MRVRINKAGHIRDGSITLLAGVTLDAKRRTVFVAADWRPAEDIIAAKRAGEPVVVEAEPWQVITRRP